MAMAFVYLDTSMGSVNFFQQLISCKSGLVLLVSLAWHAIVLAQVQPELNLYTEDHPPRSFYDVKSQQVRGSVTDKVGLLMKRAGLKHRIAILPWARAMQVAEADEFSCLFPTTQNEERRAKFVWIGPLHKSRRMIFGLAGERNPPKSLDDLRGKTIGSYRGSALNEYFLQRGFKVDLAVRHTDNPRKLINKRFDYWAVGEETGRQILKEQGLSHRIVPLFAFDEADQFLACHLHTDKALVEQLQTLVHQLSQDGSFLRIEKEYR